MNDWLTAEPAAFNALPAVIILLLGLLLHVCRKRSASRAIFRSDDSLPPQFGKWIMNSVCDAVLVLDSRFVIVHVNPAFTRVTGIVAEDAVGSRADLLFRQGDNGLFDCEIRPALDQRGEWEGEQWQENRSGVRYLARIRITAIRDETARPLHYIATFSDTTDQVRSEQQIQYLANHDPLTGLMNRTALLQKLDAAISRSGHTRTRIAVLFLDIDHFKQVNDSFGHAVGDEILRRFAARLVETLRFEDVVARFGGDEFVVLLDRIQGRTNALHVVNKIVNAFRRELDVPDQGLAVIPSIGISLYPDDAASSLELLEHADTALYQAKELKHQQYSFYEGAMTKAARDEIKRENELRRALENRELKVHYQPILDASAGRLLGMEALLRWQSPSDGLLMPGEFIHIAEQRGLIGDIGKWVIETAAREAAALNLATGGDLYVSVNVSSLQVRAPGFCGMVEQALARAGLEPGHLHIELTESLLMDSSAQVLQTLHDLRELGVKLALDDFGTGYSSLGYLRRFPINRLKIDRSFVRDIPHDAGAASIVTTIIALGHAMGMELTAEGVETEAQRDFLERHGCREQQGFHYSAALSLRELGRLFDLSPVVSVLSGSSSSSS